MRNRLIAVLTAVSLIFAALAYLTRNKYGGSTVSRGTIALEARSTVIIESVGLPVIITACYGEELIVEYAAELPVITDVTEEETRIAQDDGFAVSLFVPDALKFYIKISLPVNVGYKRIKITSAGGGVTIDGAGLDIKSVYASTKNGGINIAAVDAFLDLYSVSGKVNVDYQSFLSPAVIETVSGKVNITVPDYSAVNLDFITQTGCVTTGNIFENEYDMYKGTLFETRGKTPYKLFVKTKSADLVLKEKDTDVIGNYPRL